MRSDLSGGRRRGPWSALLTTAAVVSLATACGGSDRAPETPPAPEPAPVAVDELHIAVPGYVDPGNSAYWDSVISAVPTVREVIVNPDSGPGTAPAEPYVRLVRSLHQAGARVIGYVATGYGERDPAAVSEDIEKWREWYGITDIFLDEAAATADAIPTYATYAAEIHRSGGIAVLNPGTPPDPGYFEFADAVVTFEDPAAEYLDGGEPPEWLRTDERAEVWHIVIGTPQDQLGDAVDRAREWGADQVYVTDDVDPNPYDSVPTYWSAKLEAVV